MISPYLSLLLATADEGTFRNLRQTIATAVAEGIVHNLDVTDLVVVEAAIKTEETRRARHQQEG